MDWYPKKRYTGNPNPVNMYDLSVGWYSTLGRGTIPYLRYPFSRDLPPCTQGLGPA